MPIIRNAGTILQNLITPVHVHKDTIVTSSEKGDHLGYFIKIEFLAWIDSFMCAESMQWCKFHEKISIDITSGHGVMTIFIHAGRYNIIHFSENAHILY